MCGVSIQGLPCGPRDSTPASRTPLPFRAAAQNTAASGDAAGDADGQSSYAANPQREVQQLKGIVVVGSRRPTAGAQTAQDVHLYDKQRIEESGQSRKWNFATTINRSVCACATIGKGIDPEVSGKEGRAGH